MKLIALILLVFVNTAVNSAELFGVNLVSASRDELRAAVKMAGVKLVKEAGVGAFHDVYKGDSVLHEAKKLYLGFVKKDKKFAFAEYEFNGLQQPVMLNKLINKYGKAAPTKGKFLTDMSYSWLSDGIKINFYQDWPAHKTRLIYFNPEALQQLRSEQKLFAVASNKAKAVYQEQAF